MFTDGGTDGPTDGQTTDGCQAHRYIPQAFRSGDKILSYEKPILHLTVIHERAMLINKSPVQVGADSPV